MITKEQFATIEQTFVSKLSGHNLNEFLDRLHLLSKGDYGRANRADVESLMCNLNTEGLCLILDLLYNKIHSPYMGNAEFATMNEVYLSLRKDFQYNQSTNDRTNPITAVLEETPIAITHKIVGGDVSTMVDYLDTLIDNILNRLEKKPHVRGD